MSSAFEPIEQEPKDRTKWIWLGVIGLVVVMILVLRFAPRQAPTVSTVLAKHILISFKAGDPADRARAYEEAQEIKKRLDAGESFSKLAEQYSNDPYSSKRGGLLGWTEKGKFEDKFEEFVWSAPIGQISDIIQTQFGFHIAMVVDRRLSKVDQYNLKQGKKE